MDKQTWEHLARRIRDERGARKMTQQELADAIGVSLGTVANAELGKSIPQRSNRDAILSELGIDEDGEATVPRAGWSDDVRVVLNVVGLWLEQVEGDERAERIRRIVLGVLSSG